MPFNFKILYLLGMVSTFSLAQELPENFVLIKDFVPSILVEMRYGTNNNFTGKPIPGYESRQAVITITTASALKKVQKELNKLGLGLKIFDAYRPQKAVNYFIKWSNQPNDTVMKNKYYPNLKKETLFDLGYIALKSGHTRGSTVDVTLLYVSGPKKGKEVDMGSVWDLFGVGSGYAYKAISNSQKANRKLLRELMITHEFLPYDKEWWHFSLNNEPYPDTYFDFIVPQKNLIKRSSL
ncbi:MAG: D-alanyl-D-alanine dipeptidase [Flavobacteriaceae bacterium]|nr:MAG: D-alanyl-D-alanine dipeptidase [Flavobacteriaceae bacterium]